ncbi:MAG TPA: efflux RND transporter periplasmic adaptor subunit [Rhizomicrobium sp.]|jgi:cobalt-zinc-cadmium efflux system membrane fusion protein
MTDKSSLFGIALAVLSFALAAGCSPDNSDQKTATAGNVTLTDAQKKNIRIFTVAQTQFHKSVDTNGVVDFDNDHATAVMAPIGGSVTHLFVSPGEHVAKGQALALVNSPDYAAAVGTYRAAMVAAAATRKVADMDKDLLAHQGVSEREAEQAQSDAATAEANRATALQTLASLNVDPVTIRAIGAGKAVSNYGGIIRAPISGTVVERLITPGQLLQAGSTQAFTIADLSRVWVMAQVFGSDIDNVSLGDSAQVMVGGDAKPVAGKVTNISSEVDPNTHSVMVRVAVDNPGNLLKKQQYVRVSIQSQAATGGLFVPVSAVLHDDENLPFVYVAQPDGSYARAHVTLGYRVANRYDIPEGLRAGQKIVADGGLFLQFMQSQ